MLIPYWWFRGTILSMYNNKKVKNCQDVVYSKTGVWLVHLIEWICKDFVDDH